MATRLKYLDAAGNTIYDFTASTPAKLLEMRQSAFDMILKGIGNDIESGINDTTKTTVMVRVTVS